MIRSQSFCSQWFLSQNSLVILVKSIFSRFSEKISVYSDFSFYSNCFSLIFFLLIFSFLSNFYDDLTENTQLSRLVRALQINKRTFKDRVNNTHMNMKHKLNGIRENNNNKAKTGPKILKDRVMSVVTRMRNTNFTIILESPNIKKQT